MTSWSAGRCLRKKRRSPSPRSARGALKALGAALAAASLQRQERRGPGSLAALSRTQYENTLRDLLALPALQVRDLLPEESLAAGFDDVSSGQSLSSVHLVRYQEAADAALTAAAPSRSFTPIHLNISGRELMEAKKREAFESWKCWLNGDGLVIPSKLWRESGITVASPPAPVSGRYRFRVTGYGLHTGGSPLPVVFNYLHSPQLPYGEDLAWRDLPADQPGTVEVELDLQAGQAVDVMGWTLPHRDEVRSKIKNEPGEVWTGPSMVIERLEVDGPLETWPPESYRRLFGELPLQTHAERQAGREGDRAHASRKAPPEDWRRDPLAAVSAEPRQDAARLVEAFLPRAFRRPVSEALCQHYQRDGLETSGERGSVRRSHAGDLQVDLVFPSFSLPARGAAESWTATRWPRGFLTFSGTRCRTRALLAAAARGDLQHPDLLHAQVERMLDDPRAERFVQDFTGQWLDLDKINATTPDQALYPEFDRILLGSSVRETELFFQEILRHDRSLRSSCNRTGLISTAGSPSTTGSPVDDSVGYELRKDRAAAG